MSAPSSMKLPVYRASETVDVGDSTGGAFKSAVLPSQLLTSQRPARDMRREKPKPSSTSEGGVMEVRLSEKVRCGRGIVADVEGAKDSALIRMKCRGCSLPDAGRHR